MKCQHIFTLLCQINFFWLPYSGTNANHIDWLQGIAPTVPLDGIWQLVSGSRHQLFVYSAFVEQRFSALAIRIIAMTKVSEHEDIRCRISLGNSTVFTVRGSIRITTHPFELSYSGCFIYCEIMKDLQVAVDDLINSSVQVVFDEVKRTRSNLLKINDSKRQSNVTNKIYACVRALHSTYSRAAWLIEWFEANLLLGVSHFYMYNQSMSDQISCILDHYRRLGFITLLPWNLALSPKILNMDGQTAALNDCLYRSMPHAEWLLNIDLDELVFPRPRRSLQDHFNILSRSVKKAPSAIIFRNAFFYVYLDDDKRTKASKYPLLTSRKTRRLALMPPSLHDDRTKYAVRPNHAVELGIHYVYEFTQKHFALTANPETGFLHHYRMLCIHGKKCSDVETEADYHALEWADDLYRRVKLRRHILNSCLPLTGP